MSVNRILSVIFFKDSLDICCGSIFCHISALIRMHLQGKETSSQILLQCVIFALCRNKTVCIYDSRFSCI
jgi:hypothetical protein